MKKKDLIDVISKKSQISRSESKLCVEVIVEELTLAIVSGEGVEVRGFGGFYKRHRKGRMGINPKTGEKTEVAAKFVPFFKPGKFLKEAVDKG
jgi:integration host factor subunit beta|tara:strand:+ start:437 stop:715 length:279 start_codon:yes stop_codon:yes gene_type:complete